MAHDFIKFPELTNNQMQFYYFESPHKQIFESFRAEVVKVHDGDTITLRWRERDFDFPLRLMNIQAPELKDPGGDESQSWLEDKLLDHDVDILINSALRVEKWGRLLGYVTVGGGDVGQASIVAGKSVAWEQRHKPIPNFSKILREIESGFTGS